MTTQKQGTSLDALASIMQMLQGSQATKKTSGGGFSETSGIQMDQNTVNALLKQALGSTQGLAATAQGQRGAGLYNSSTNRLLSNDLLARLTAQTAAAVAPKYANRTAAPTTERSSTPGLMQGGDMQKLMLGLTAYNKLGGIKGIKAGLGEIADEAKGFFGAGEDTPDFGSSTISMSDGAPTYMDAPMFSANSAISNAVDPGFGAGLESLMQFQYSSPQYQSVDAPTYDAAATEDTTNFQTGVSAGSFNRSSFGNPSASEVLAEAPAKSDTTSISSGSQSSTATPTLNASGTASGLYSLYKGISALTDDNSANDVSGAVNTASGAYSTYKAYDTYQAAAKAAEAANAASAASGAAGTASAFDSMSVNWGGATGGDTLGYVGAAVSAFNAPEAQYGKDYRYAVGSAVLNYFNMGWAAPIVDAIARPALDASMEAGYDSLGYAGVVMADPIGAPLSGQYDQGKLVSSTIDPANIFGGNPGGSTGKMVAAVLDPVGAMLGNKGAFGAISEAVDKAESSDPIGSAIGQALGQGSGGGGLPGMGKVICTELAMQDRLPAELYRKAISPSLIMKGQMLRGYHVVGVPLVKLARKSPFWAEKITPYVADYIRHKAGDKNVRGFIVKAVLHPISWVLGFFNRNPDYYKTLYPYRRVRNG